MSLTDDSMKKDMSSYNSSSSASSMEPKALYSRQEALIKIQGTHEYRTQLFNGAGGDIPQGAD